MSRPMPRPRRLLVVTLVLSLCATIARAQDHADHDAHDNGARWTFMQDGVVWVMFNDRGSSRGGSELKAPNWWWGWPSGGWDAERSP